MRIEITKYTDNPNSETNKHIGTYTNSYESRSINPDMITAVTDCYLNEVHLKDLELHTKADFDKLIELLINAKESIQENKNRWYEGEQMAKVPSVLDKY